MKGPTIAPASASQASCCTTGGVAVAAGGIKVGVDVGGTGVAVGGTRVGVDVGGTGVAVGGTRVGVAVGGTGVAVGGTRVGVDVGGTGVAVGGTRVGVAVDGTVVDVGVGDWAAATVTRSTRVCTSLPLMMSSCCPAVRLKTFVANCGESGAPLPRQDTVLSSNPCVNGTSQTISGLTGSPSMFTKIEFEPSFAAFTTILTT